MKQIELVINNPSGLHARPAKMFSNLAKQFSCDIHITNADKKANAKSVISVLTLGVHAGTSVTIEANGDDEEEAITALETAISNGLGEELDTATTESKTLSNEEYVHMSERKTEQHSDFHGVSGAPGIAIGNIFQYSKSTIEISNSFTDTNTELSMFMSAVKQATHELTALRANVSDQSIDAAEIIDVHLEMLEDPELIESTRANIESGLGAATAWQKSFTDMALLISDVDNETLSERSKDVKDVGDRILRILSGHEPEDLLLSREGPLIVVARDLSPSDTMALDQNKVVGFCTTEGGPTSHTAILARSLGIPAIVSADIQTLDIVNDTKAIINGTTGALISKPDNNAVAEAKKLVAFYHKKHKDNLLAAHESATTKDGHRVPVFANIGTPSEVPKALLEGAEGIGLLRTEWLFLERSTPPSEEEQFIVMQEIMTMLAGKPLVIRTLDIGGDKPLPYIAMKQESNPFLGERGVRLYMSQQDLFTSQLRSIFRAAKPDLIRVMFPMVSDRDELRKLRNIFNDIRENMSAPRVELGIMIEVPSAAIMAEALAEDVDFFSIGTNDLTQYTLAADRLNPTLNYLADAIHPAVLKLIDQTISAAHAKNKHVSLCGELASDKQALPVLLGLGIDEISVSISALANVKALIRTLSLYECKKIAQVALQCTTAAEVRHKIKQLSNN